MPPSERVGVQSPTIRTMDGILLIDKPSGPTSHDIVARLRAVTRERSIGHTGTLDPRATGLLPLVLGKATRLASVLAGGDKTYEASIRLGVRTTTDDAEGTVVSEWTGALPDTGQIENALRAFVGTYEQTPPAHSAKKVAGKRAYELARRDTPVVLRPATVTVKTLVVTGIADGVVRITLRSSPGFYVRALARDLGDALGCGAHLLALRRTHVGDFDVREALTLAEAERLGPDVQSRLVPPADALRHLPAVTVTDAGLKRAVHGNTLSPEHLTGRWVPPVAPGGSGQVRVLAPDGHLVAVAHSRGGFLHPAVVLG